jgi:hypothetical protein
MDRKRFEKVPRSVAHARCQNYVHEYLLEIMDTMTCFASKALGWGIQSDIYD